MKQLLAAAMAIVTLGCGAQTSTQQPGPMFGPEFAFYDPLPSASSVTALGDINWFQISGSDFGHPQVTCDSEFKKCTLGEGASLETVMKSVYGIVKDQAHESYQRQKECEAQIDYAIKVLDHIANHKKNVRKP